MESDLYVINKINITAEAKFDYDDMFGDILPTPLLRKEVEEYINYMQVHKYFSNRYYFRCVWYDKTKNKDLMLFFYKGKRFANMQLWNLVGVCEQSDWNEELEEDGYIRNWLMSKITELNDEYDWVVAYRKQRQEQMKPYESGKD